MSNKTRNSAVRRSGSHPRLTALLLLACSCRATPDGSAPPEASKGSEPSSLVVLAEAPAPAPPAAPAATPTPEAPSAAAPSAAGSSATPVSLTQPIELKPSSVPTGASEPGAGDGEALLLANLTNAVKETPFSAVVQYIRKDLTPLEDDEVKVTYQVRVLEPIRGPKLEKLSYFAIVEKGEDTSFEKRPVILTLCKGKQGYYWPGTGAEFTRTKSTRALVAKLRQELSPEQKTFKQCRPVE
jgi:hypothetical protein